MIGNLTCRPVSLLVAVDVQIESESVTRSSEFLLHVSVLHAIERSNDESHDLAQCAIYIRNTCVEDTALCGQRQNLANIVTSRFITLNQ